jgi:hypothetical protein
VRTSINQLDSKSTVRRDTRPIAIACTDREPFENTATLVATVDGRSLPPEVVNEYDLLVYAKRVAVEYLGEVDASLIDAQANAVLEDVHRALATYEAPPIPETPKKGNGSPEQPTPMPDNAAGAPPITPVVICMADIDPREVRWLWRGRIPLGRLTVLGGIPGAGKSYLTCDLAARISTGTPWPDGAQNMPGSVLIVSAEDDPADTIRPRLDACHADVERIHVLSAVRRLTPNGDERETVFTLADVAALEEAMKALPDLRLVVIDPIGSYMGGGVDAHRDSEVRSVLAPVAQLAERYGVAVLIVAHRRKGSAGTADETVLGSRAFTGIARAVWHLTRDTEDKRRRLLLPGKMNLGPEGTGLAFAIAGEPVATVQWERGDVNTTADEALAAERAQDGPGRPPEKRDAATDWLQRELAGGIARPVKELKKSAEEAGLGWRTVQRVASPIVDIESLGFGAGSAWKLRPAA